mgnify:FL=1
MAFPWLQAETFDDGSRGGFDSETDASAILDFPHYVELARTGLHPWQGAHALRCVLSGTATGFIQEDDGFDVALDGAISIWFPVLIGADFTLNDGDAVILLALQSTGAVNEVVVGVDRSGANYRLFAGETGATNTQIITRSNKRWHQVEVVCALDAGGANDGTIDFYVDGGAVGAQITGLDQAAITQARLGAVSGTAAGNAGSLLIGGIIADDLRVYPRDRFPLDTFWVTRDIAAWLGPCTIDSIVLTGTGTDAVLTVLDTDIYEATALSFSREPVAYVRNVTAGDQAPGQNLPLKCSRGAYCQLTGANPQAWVSIASPSDVVKSAARYVDRGRTRAAFR